MAAQLRQRDRNAGMCFCSFSSQISSRSLSWPPFFSLLTSFILLNSNHSLINLSYWMDEEKKQQRQQQQPKKRNWCEEEREKNTFYSIFLCHFHFSHSIYRSKCDLLRPILYNVCVLFDTPHQIRLLNISHRIALPDSQPLSTKFQNVRYVRYVMLHFAFP